MRHRKAYRIAGFSCSPHHGSGMPVTQVFTLLLSVWNHGSFPVMKQPSYRKKKHDKEENRNQHNCTEQRSPVTPPSADSGVAAAGALPQPAIMPAAVSAAIVSAKAFFFIILILLFIIEMLYHQARALLIQRYGSGIILSLRKMRCPECNISVRK